MAKVELKQPIVDQISETIKDAKAVMLVKYLGLTVEEDTAMRKELREAGVTYKVFKNTLMNRAFQGTECEALCKDLEGGNALVVSKDDPTKPANIMAKYAKKYKPLTMVSGIIDGCYADAKKLDEVANIPSRDVLLGRLLGSMQSPITNFARVIKQIAEKDGEAVEAAPAE
ncbi:MAG: 50S ribosomal protein L10 [Lachnospiraceae bacterium]|nr:50S ribosomal protein L10 [Lachnospiraceae bacterium]